MVEQDTRTVEQVLNRTSRATIQITGTCEIDHQQLLRGIHALQTTTSLFVKIEDTTCLFLSTHGYSRDREKAIKGAEIAMQSLQGLLIGVRHKVVSQDALQPAIKQHCALLRVTGSLQPSADLSSLISKIQACGGNAYLYKNIKPVEIEYDYYEDEALVTKKPPPIEGYFNKETIKCKIGVLTQPTFYLTFTIFLTDDNLETLQNHVHSIQAIVSGTYNPLELEVYWGNKALKGLNKMLTGQLIDQVVYPVEALANYFQIPQVYGIQHINVPEFPPPPETPEGVEIGKGLGNNNETLSLIRLDPTSIFEHMAVWGSTGTGKSTLLKHLLVKFHNEAELKCLVFDLHNEYREVTQLLDGEIGEDILIINPFLTEFSINPLELPQVQDIERDIAVVERVGNFISLLKQIFILGEIQEARIREALFNIYKKSSNPTIEDLIDQLTQKRRDNLASKLYKFTWGFYGRIFNQPHTSLPFDKIENTTTILELNGLPLDLRTFFVSVFLILWWDHRRIKRPNETIQHVLFLDEFPNYQGLNVVRKMLSEARKFSQALVCASQGPNQITDRNLLGELVRNTATKIIFRQDQQSDQKIASTALGGLTKDQTDYLSLMETGEAVVKLKNTKQAFRMKTEPLPDLDKISDDVIAESMGGIVKLQNAESELSELEDQFLTIVFENPGIVITQVAIEVGIRASNCYNIKKDLIDKKLLMEEDVRVGRGRPRKVMKLTGKACELLRLETNKQPASYGGEEHISKVKEIAEMLKSDGWSVKIEKDNCDIKAEKENVKLAVEVETGKRKAYDHILTNVNRDLKWADRIVIVCPNKKIKQEISEIIKDKSENTKVVSYSELKLSNIL